VLEFDGIRRSEDRLSKFLEEPHIVRPMGGTGDADGSDASIVVGDQSGGTRQSVEPLFSVHGVALFADLLEFGEEFVSIRSGVFRTVFSPCFLMILSTSVSGLDAKIALAGAIHYSNARLLPERGILPSRFAQRGGQ
jgi:hypothetical protein